MHVRYMKVILLSTGLAAALSAGPIPAGYSCNATCGTLGANGVVTLSPFGTSTYLYVSTNGGITGGGTLPTGPLGTGTETDGSTLSSPVFAANPGDALNFYFNYVTSDGTPTFPDYAWAELLTSGNVPVALLFSARTKPSGSIVPGFGMPPNMATLTPPSVPIIPGGPAWLPLGSSPGQCWQGSGQGCGYTGWVLSSYTISSAGSYRLEFGTTNWGDTAYDSGLAIDGIMIAGQPIGTPEPGTVGLVGAALLAAGAFRKRIAA